MKSNATKSDLTDPLFSADVHGWSPSNVRSRIVISIGPRPCSCQFLHRHRKQPLIGFAIGHGLARVAAALHAPLQRHPLVIGPKVLLRGENLEGLALDLPDLVNVEDHLRLEVA